MGWWESGRINTVLAADVGTHHSVEIKADQDLDRTLDQLGVLPDRQEEEEGGGGGGGGGGGMWNCAAAAAAGIHPHSSSSTCGC